MSVLRSLLTTGVLACSLWLTVLPVSAQTDSPAVQQKSAEVTLQRNPDEACLRCHKPQQNAMHGKHAGAINPNNKLPLTCTNCHGSPSLHHREGVKDVMRFNEPMFGVEQQNSVCLSCHLPETLQKAFWPHDVHLAKVSCASCHTLHPQQDKVQGLGDKGRIKLCVDCHRQQQDDPAFNPASVRLDKGQP